MTHHHAAVWQRVEKVWKPRRKVRLITERVSPGEGRIGAHAERRRAATEATAQEVEQEALAIVESVMDWSHAPALAHPCGGRLAPGDCEQRVTHLWKQLYMLVAVDEVGRVAEMLGEHAYLPCDLRHQRVRLERAQRGAQQERAERQERAIASRAKPVAKRTERRRQRHMQPDRHTLRFGIERLQGKRFA